MKHIHRSKIPYVLALTILDGETMPDGEITSTSRVRYCVRRREANLTHPDVVSVPTQRIPSVLAEDIRRTAREVGQCGDTGLLTQEFVSSERHKGHDSLVYAVESLLSRKLGVASQLELDEVAFEAALAAFHRGVALYANLDEDEELAMINVRVHITKGADLFPEKTGSYSLSRWTTVGDFVKMWNGKDVTVIGLSPKDAIGVCVTGLCISSTYDLLAAEIGEKEITANSERPIAAQGV